MGIRETLNQNPAITTGATIGIIVIALGFIVWQIVGSDGSSAPTEMFYTVDDGATHFADEANKLVPFDKDGKPASRVYIFTCDDRATTFVAYLERLTPEAKKKMEEATKAAQAAQGSNAPPPVDMDFIQMEGTEVRKPGADGKWVKRNSAEGEKVTNVTCPDGKTEKLNIVMPND